MRTSIINVKKSRKILPKSNSRALVDHAVGLGVSVCKEKLQNNVHQECYLSNNVQNKQILGQSPEKSEFHGSEEGGVDCPYQYEFRPYPIQPASTVQFALIF